MNRHHLLVLLALSASTFLASGAWGDEQFTKRPPPLQNLKELGNVANVTHIMVTLKPNARVYVNRHYDWGGKAKAEDRREEAPMSVDEIRKLSKAAGVQLKLEPKELSGVRFSGRASHLDYAAILSLA